MALQQACIDLDKAFRNVFEGRARFPRFKRKQGEQSSYHCSGKIGFGEDWIQRPKIGTRIRAVIHRPITGELKSITVSRTVTGKYFGTLPRSSWRMGWQSRSRSLWCRRRRLSAPTLAKGPMKRA
jgi:putative transposase